MKKVFIISGIVILIGLGVFFAMRSRGNTIQFRTAPVTLGNIRSTVTATGTMNAVTTVLVGTQASGRIKQINVDFNSRVKKGEVIAEIDPSSFQAQVDQARANLLQARAVVEKDKAALADLRRIRDRNKQLFSQDLIARADRDTSEANSDASAAQLAADTAQVAQMEAALRFAETNLGYTAIVSPVDGVVVSKNVDVGQTVAASFQTPTLFTIAQDLTKMQIDTNIDEADIGKIDVGQNVEFSVDAYTDQIFRGKVSQVRISPIIVQNVVTYDVVVKVDNPDLKLKPGMTANVSVVVGSKEGVLRIPNAALRFRPTEKDGVKAPAKPVDKTAAIQVAAPDREGGRPGTPPGKEGVRPAIQRSYAVWVLENNKPKRVPVSLGISDGSFTEIVSGDLAQGQEVIVESLTKPAKNNSGSPQSAPRFIR
jgi:HlyD family secretion protein